MIWRCAAQMRHEIAPHLTPELINVAQQTVGKWRARNAMEHQPLNAPLERRFDRRNAPATGYRGKKSGPIAALG